MAAAVFPKTTRSRRALTTLTVGALAVLICPVAAGDEPERVFQLAKRYAMNGPDYQFDVTIESGDSLAEGTVDPSAAPGERLTLKSQANTNWSDEFQQELSEFESQVQEVLWCQSILDGAAGYRTATREADTYVYELDLSVDTNNKEEVKFAKHVRSQVTVSATDGAVLRYTMRAPKPFRPVMVAKIERFDLLIDCERSPDGRTYSRQMRADIEGRAMMKSFKETQRRSISNLVAVPQS